MARGTLASWRRPSLCYTERMNSPARGAAVANFSSNSAQSSRTPKKASRRSGDDTSRKKTLGAEKEAPCSPADNGFAPQPSVRERIGITEEAGGAKEEVLEWSEKGSTEGSTEAGSPALELRGEGIEEALPEELRREEVEGEGTEEALPEELRREELGGASAGGWTPEVESSRSESVRSGGEEGLEQEREIAVVGTLPEAEADDADEAEAASPVNYDDEGLTEVVVEEYLYRFDAGKQGTALCLSVRVPGSWRWRYLGELRWDGRDLRSRALERRLLQSLSSALRAFAAESVTS